MLGSTNSLETTDELNETNYDNDLEAIAQRQENNPMTSESESAMSANMIIGAASERILNETNSFKSLSSMALSSTSSISSTSSNFSTEQKKKSSANFYSIKINPNTATTNTNNDYYLSLINLTTQNQRLFNTPHRYVHF